MAAANLEDSFHLLCSTKSHGCPDAGQSFALHEAVQDGAAFFPFCLCWANHNWSRTWVGGDQDILMEVKYGDQDEWEKHFQYLLPFFMDPRYIKMNGKPVFIIYQPQLIKTYREMIPYLNKRALEEGIGGLTIISQSLFTNTEDDLEELVDYKIQYEPNYSRTRAWDNKTETFFTYPPFLLDLYTYKVKGKLNRITHGKVFKFKTYSYDAIWRYILRRPEKDEKQILGAFVKCDVTPRRQERALIYRGDTPRKFAIYLTKLIKKCKRQQKLIFLSAWNEWGEGMYLEPDEKYKYAYLEALQKAVKDESIG